MKEIKAYVRLAKAEEVACALEKEGAAGFTVIEVKALGAACVPEDEQFSIKYGEQASPITKFEVVCRDEDLDRLVDIITSSAYTNHPGDGMIFVTEVVSAVKIRSGERGEDALSSCRAKDK